ncbi:MAG: hypothetical protein Q9169_004931 [Polycauliona sp. 2 TL-2023]
MTPGLADEYPAPSIKSTVGLAHKDNASTAPKQSNASPKNIDHLIRSASSTQLFTLSAPDATPGVDILRRSLSENVLINSRENAPDIQYREKAGNHVHVQEAGDQVQRNTKQPRSVGVGPKVAVSRFSLDPSGAEEEETEEILDAHEPRQYQPPIHDDKASSIARSLSRFTRRSWVSRARSSSPSPLVHDQDPEGEASSHLTTSSPSSTLKSSTDSPIPDHFPKGRRRPLSTLMRNVPSDPTVPSVPAIPTSFSTDKLPFIQNQVSGQSRAVRRLKSWETLQSIGSDSSRRKDELSNAFRTLDGEFQKQVLLPQGHGTLPRYLDRRVSTLNKWWTGLLTMLIGRNGESVSGNDRPTILDAVTSIMVRPEWALPYQAVLAPSDGNARPFLKSRSTTSLASQSSDFLAESIFHNTKRCYAEKLLCQMGYVVDKMSLRNVPASVVTFCGKATAYAFFYCDGVAEILVRLWTTPPEMIRRVLAEHHLPRDADLKSSTETVARNFPSGLHGLGFKSAKATVKHLRSRPRFPNGAGRVNWYGPWVRRWSGKDTDLFFIFTRIYHNLMGSYLPPDLTSQGRLCVPAYILLQAQVLSILDTIVLGSDTPSPLEPAFRPPVEYDGMFGEADASAPVLPLSPASINRSMAENRLIILLRDYLSGGSSVSDRQKEIFAGSFEDLLKAAARRVSVFNYTACFTFCDVLEEALPILCRYSTLAASSYAALDWSFWLHTCRQMMDSQNTMTQLRVYAFLYSLWGTITAEDNRKHQVCLEWLLDEEYFDAQFNHWCPMVRAYYMRLLCWRVGRLSSASSDLDASILATLVRRLDHVWSTFCYLQDDFDSKSGPRLSTAPCSPAPGRQLLVVRNDSQPSHGGMFLTFDSILSMPATTQPRVYEKNNSPNTPTGSKDSSATKKTVSMGRKSWSALKNMMSFTGAAADPPPSSVGESPARLTGSKTQGQTNTGGHSSSKHAERPKTPLFQAQSFKFSLEWIDDEASPFGKERQLYRPQLPVPTSELLERPEMIATRSGGHDAPGAAVKVGKYAGRALAEWELVLAEFRVFSEKRRTEGAPEHSHIETPTLGPKRAENGSDNKSVPHGQPWTRVNLLAMLSGLSQDSLDFLSTSTCLSPYLVATTHMFSLKANGLGIVIPCFVSTIGLSLISSQTSPIYRLHSEWLCWVLIFLSTKADARYGGGDGLGKMAAIDVDRLALAIIVACLCQSLAQVEWVLPLLAPIIFFLDRDHSPLIVATLHSDKHDSTRSTFSYQEFIFTLGLAIPSSAIFSFWMQQPAPFAFGLAFLLAQAAAFYFIGKRGLTMDVLQPRTVDTAEALPCRIVLVLTMLILLTSQSPSSWIAVALSGALRAIWWLSVMILSRQGTTKAIPAISTYGFAVSQAFNTSGFQAIPITLVAFAALYQAHRYLPPAAGSSRLQTLLVLLGFASLIGEPCTNNMLRMAQWPSLSLSSSRTNVHNHPIEYLVHKSRPEFSATIERQSKSLQEAIQEYERRYRRSPPPGFDSWYRMADEANATLIDEYDLLMQDLEPFWGFSAQELHSKTAMISAKDVTVKRLIVRDHKMTIDSAGYAAYGDQVAQIMNWTLPFGDFLPDMDLVFNNFDEPRVIVPHGLLESSLRNCPHGGESHQGITPSPPDMPFEFLNNGKQSIWDLVTLSCSPDSPASNTRFSPPPRAPYNLGFVRTATFVRNTCSNPGASMQHGFVVAPDTLHITHQPVPIWSQSKLGTFQDLIMPAPAYTVKKDQKKEHQDNTPWSSKADQLYWVGSTSGGNSHHGNWRYMHRERLVGFVNSPNQQITLLNQTRPNGGGPWRPFNSTMARVQNLFNVAFTAAIQCGSVCDSIKQKYPFHDRGGPQDAFRYRFLLDMDGNAWSGRYYSLLRSISAVIKQSLFREFQGDAWIKPWVHYIPPSMDGSELPEMMRFLTQTGEGREIAERIAGEGRAGVEECRFAVGGGEGDVGVGEVDGFEEG